LCAPIIRDVLILKFGVRVSWEWREIGETEREQQNRRDARNEIHPFHALATLPGAHKIFVYCCQPDW
jgi:hypothetical protein